MDVLDSPGEVIGCLSANQSIVDISVLAGSIKLIGSRVDRRFGVEPSFSLWIIILIRELSDEVFSWVDRLQLADVVVLAQLLRQRVLLQRSG